MEKRSDNAFERVRRAKVLSVDPHGIARNDLDGSQERGRVFALLHSFDDRDTSVAEFEAKILALLDLPQPPTAAAVLDYYRTYYSGHFPVPEVCASDLAEADAILRHRFTFQGETHQLPTRIDWDHNPGMAHWGYDLNRFGFLRPLCGAYLQSGRRQYAEQVARFILDWIAATDICDSFTPGPDPAAWELSVKSRYVWLSHLEPAIHLVAWGEALAALLPRCPDLVTPHEFLQILKSVHDQLQWLEVIIPEGGHGNGLITGACCQLRALAYFPTFRDAPRLASVALDRLAATLDRQVLPDGVQQELTPHYHFCVTSDLLTALEALPHLGIAAPPVLRERLRGMLWYLRQTLTPDGKQVAFNDGDGGLGGVTAAYLARPLAREILGDWADRELTSERFPCAGVMIMRQGSGRGREELYLAFDGGPFGAVHQHEDALSFWLSAYGRSFIVDPGRHLYDWSERSFYPYLQTTRAHSTIRVDDLDQNSRAHPERWVSWEPLPLRWEVGESGEVTAQATYDLGYGPELVQVRHSRTIRFLPQPGYWLLEDFLEGDGTRAIESRFQFAPGDLTIETGLARTTYPDANLALFFLEQEWDEARVEKGEHEPRAGWYSDALGQIEPAPALALYARGRKLPLRVRHLLFPYRGGDLPQEARDLWLRMKP